MKHSSKLFISLIIIILFGCNNEKTSTNDSFIFESKDTVIQGINVMIVPTLIDSFVIESDYYQIYANYANLIEDSFYFNKTFESLLITKNGNFINQYFKADLKAQLNTEKNPKGFRNGNTINLVEIENLQYKTFSVVFNPNMSAPSHRRYAFIDFNETIATSDTILDMNSIWFKNESIKATNNSFNILIFNHLFNVNVPIGLKRTNNTLIPYIDTSKATLDRNFIVYNVEINKNLDYSESNDSIILYTSYESENNKIIPVNIIADSRFYKAARYYENIDINNFYKIIIETETGITMSKEDYMKNIFNYDTKWFLFIESGEIKGWIRKKRDYNRLGFHEAG